MSELGCLQSITCKNALINNIDVEDLDVNEPLTIDTLNDGSLSNLTLKSATVNQNLNFNELETEKYSIRVSSDDIILNATLTDTTSNFGFGSDVYIYTLDGSGINRTTNPKSVEITALFTPDIVPGGVACIGLTDFRFEEGGDIKTINHVNLIDITPDAEAKLTGFYRNTPSDIRNVDYNTFYITITNIGTVDILRIRFNITSNNVSSIIPTQSMLLQTQTITQNEGTPLSLTYRGVNDYNIYTITGMPSGFSDTGTEISGTLEAITNGVDVQRQITVTQINPFGNSINPVTITVNITIDIVNLPDNDIASLTIWDTAIHMTGTSEYLKQNNVDFYSNSITQPLKLGGNQAVTIGGVAGKTSAATTARPWAVACVVYVDTSVSNYSSYWAQTLNQTSKIHFIREDLQLRFVWGFEPSTGGAGSGNDKIVMVAWNAPTSGWYGYYIESDGYKDTHPDITNQKLIDSIRIIQVDLTTGDLTDIITSENLTWTINADANMRTSLTQSSTQVGRPDQTANTAKTFDTKIASLVITTLRLDVDLPSDTEIETMVRDPIKWLNDFKEGKLYRQSSTSGDTLDFQIGTSNASKGTQVWLMGDGPNDSVSEIRNKCYDVSGGVTNLNLINMDSSNFETVTIPGLT